MTIDSVPSDHCGFYRPQKEEEEVEEKGEEEEEETTS